MVCKNEVHAHSTGLIVSNTLFVALVWRNRSCWTFHQFLEKAMNGRWKISPTGYPFEVVLGIISILVVITILIQYKAETMQYGKVLPTHQSAEGNPLIIQSNDLLLTIVLYFTFYYNQKWENLESTNTGCAIGVANHDDHTRHAPLQFSPSALPLDGDPVGFGYHFLFFFLSFSFFFFLFKF